MRFDIITIFPKIFSAKGGSSPKADEPVAYASGENSYGYFGHSIVKRAIQKKKIKIKIWNLRDFVSGKHKTVDDRPFGGGPGMVFKIEPIWKAVNFSKRQAPSAKRKKVILFSTRGKKFDAKITKRLALCDQLILICGRYEGVDERVARYVADEEISIGDFVLSGGELAAMVVIEAVSRFIPGFLGKYESLEEIKGSYSVYTRPEVFWPGRSKKYDVRNKRSNKSRLGWRVPKVLLSGDHKKIEAWRRAHA